MNSSRVQQELLDNAFRNFIRGLRDSDTNALLHVGAGGPPPSPATPPPTLCPVEFSTGPDSDGDCMCNAGLTCWNGVLPYCPFSFTESTGRYSNTWFLPFCTTCTCSASAPTSSTTTTTSSSSKRGAQVAWSLGAALVLLLRVV